MKSPTLFRALRIAILPMLLVGVAASLGRVQPNGEMAAPPPRYAPMIQPTDSAVFTATNEIRSLDWDGTALYAATAGGVWRFERGKRTKWTRRDGLPANETFDLARKNGILIARSPVARASWDGKNWKSESEPEWKSRAPETVWKQQEVVANLDGLQIGDEKFTLPAQASGTHISALSARGNFLLVAVYGDGLWRFDGKSWTRGPLVADEAREILSLAGDDKNLFIGTRRNGVFAREGETWKSLNSEDEPFNHNVQNLAEFDSVLWASTLDDGLVARTGKGWRHVSTPQISSSAPRQMLNWRSRLYVRHGNGIVDTFDGANWEKNALKSIPRRGVYALAGDDQNLLAAGWGGWAQWNGESWTPHYDLPGLKGVPIMNLAMQGDDIWIGTQSRGIAKWTRATNELKFFDERDGLTDDWITALCVDENRVWAGTFVGGLHVFEDGKWREFGETKGENVTAIVPDQSGGVWVATRRGCYRVRGEKAEKIGGNWLDSEQQALLNGKNGLWIGARTSLNYWKFDS